MKKLLNNPVAVGLLALTALVTGFWPQIKANLAARNHRPPPAAPAPGEAAALEAAVGPGDAGSLSRQLRQIFEKNTFAPSGRDPFTFHEEKVVAVAAPEAPAARETLSIQLAAIWMQEGASLALLNHQIAITGDKVGFIQVAEISPDGVWLLQTGTRVFLHLGEQHTFEQSTEPSAPAPHEK